MTLHDQSVCAILLDIEGTTTPLDFVYKALFPYARSHLRQFLSRHLLFPEVGADIAELHEEHRVDTHQGLNPPLLRHNTPKEELASVAEYIEWLMDRDRKSTSLKSLQGRIWEEGYKRGELRGQVFDDVPRAL